MAVSQIKGNQAPQVVSPIKANKKSQTFQKKSKDDLAAKVALSSKGMNLAQQVQSGQAGGSSRAMKAAEAREKRMSDLVDFYANKLVRASKKIESEQHEVEPSDQRAGKQRLPVSSSISV